MPCSTTVAFSAEPNVFEIYSCWHVKLQFAYFNFCPVFYVDEWTSMLFLSFILTDSVEINHWMYISLYTHHKNFSKPIEVKWVNYQNTRLWLCCVLLSQFARLPAGSQSGYCPLHHHSGLSDCTFRFIFWAGHAISLVI